MPVVIAVLVFGGLGVAVLVSVWIESPAVGALPGVALGSQAVLVAERFVALFVVWLLVLVVSAQALRGRLPIEISGRGVRYAEAERSQDGLASTQEALSQMDEEMKALRRHVEGLVIDDRDH